MQLVKGYNCSSYLDKGVMLFNLQQQFTTLKIYMYLKNDTASQVKLPKATSIETM